MSGWLPQVPLRHTLVSAAPSHFTIETLGTRSSVASCRRKFDNFERDLERRYFGLRDPKTNGHSDGGPISDGQRTTMVDLPVERERRHYPCLDNVPSEPQYQARARRFIPHGHGDEFEFRPHNANQQPEYTDCGPDWSSRLRYIPAPNNPKYVTEIWPEEWKALRTYPWMSRTTAREWTLHPEGKDVTVRCSFHGVHKATVNSQTEISTNKLFGKGRLVVDKRNGINLAAPGDKNYQVVEYSPNFHKKGSTRPLVHFGGGAKSQPDTFVPLQELPPIPRESYREKESQRQLSAEMSDVQSLERWRPATPLRSSVTLALPKPEALTTVE